MRRIARLIEPLIKWRYQGGIAVSFLTSIQFNLSKKALGHFTQYLLAISLFTILINRSNRWHCKAYQCKYYNKSASNKKPFCYSHYIKIGDLQFPFQLCLWECLLPFRDCSLKVVFGLLLFSVSLWGLARHINASITIRVPVIKNHFVIPTISAKAPEINRPTGIASEAILP